MAGLQSESQRIGSGVELGQDVLIRANSIEIADNTKILDGVSIICQGDFRIGHHGIIGEGAKVVCNNLIIGDWFYSCEGLEIGAGGCNSKDSNVVIGSRVGVFERVLINPNFPVSIGDNCGIGREVQIWTHGAWLDPLSGFPSDFGPVSIGSNVWLPARSIMLPNSSIGDNCVIGINSVINRRIPSGSFAAGIPARVVRANAYPVSPSIGEADGLLRRIVSDWQVQLEYKVPYLQYSVECFDVYKICLRVGEDETTFDCQLKVVEGSSNHYSEDLRDYLRRRGIKIFTENFFRSIPFKVNRSHEEER